MSQDFYSTNKFQPSIDSTRNAQQNFAKLEKALADRKNVMLKVEEQFKKNAGLHYQPTEITAELNTNFATLGAGINKSFQDWSLQNAGKLDKNSANFRPGSLAKHNVYKNDILNVYKNFNNAQASYQTIIKNYQDGNLDLTEEEYNNISNQYQDLKSIDASRVSINENGNLMLSSTDDQGEVSMTPLAGYKGFDFTKGLVAPKPIDYTKAFQDNLQYTDTAQSFDTSYDDAIVKSSDRMRIGAFTEFLAAKYPEATNHEEMAKNTGQVMKSGQTLEEEFKQWHKEVAINKATKTRSTQSGIKVTPGDFEKALRIQGLTIPTPDHAGNIKPIDEERLRTQIRTAIDDKHGLYPHVYDQFMASRGIGAGYTAEQLEDEWMGHLLRNKPTDDINYDPNIAPGGVVNPEEQVSGALSISTGTPIMTRLSYEEQEGRSGAVTEIDPASIPISGFYNTSYLGEDLSTALPSVFANIDNFGSINMTSSDMMGAYELDALRRVTPSGSDEDKKSKKAGDPIYAYSTPYELGNTAEAMGQFTPTTIIPNVLYATQPITLNKIKKRGTSDPEDWWGWKDKKENATLVIPAGAPIDKALMDEIGYQGMRDFVSRGPMVQGQYGSENRSMRTIMVPLDKVQKQMSAASNHDISAYANMDTYVAHMEDDQLMEYMKDSYWAVAATKELQKRGY
jgi:hypothetical protein